MWTCVECELVWSVGLYLAALSVGGHVKNQSGHHQAVDQQTRHTDTGNRG